MELQFWGVRGSLPTPGPNTLAVGGNTTCVSLHFEDRLFIFDAGTGIRQLGEYLERGRSSRLHGCIFLTHYHWDHIQGLPFFAPVFRKENRFSIFGEPKKGTDLKEILAEQMMPPFFPVMMDEQEGIFTFNGLEPGASFEIAPGIVVRTERLNHPNGAIGYRLDAAEGSLCVVTDHEHPAEGLDNRVVEFARDATVLIHDAQYHPDEKQGPKAGWGHSSWEEAALTAKEANVQRLYLSHHDPARSDGEVCDILSRSRRIFANTEVATENTLFDFRNELL